MKRFHLMMAIGVMVLLLTSVSWASLSQFSGTWVNVDSGTRGVTKLDIQISGSNVTVQAWGSCTPSDCDWGKVTAYGYTPSVSSSPVNDARAISAIFTTGFSQTLMIIKPVGSQLQAEIFTRFTDGSGRANYNAVYNFKRQLMVKPIGPILGTIKPFLATPKQLSPVNGSVFGHYPRSTTLKWQAVTGAASYTVEVDCLGCCGSTWCADQGKIWKVVPGLTGTSYTFNFVGAQPGRWRVWAVGSGGQESAKSGWWEFKYTK